MDPLNSYFCILILFLFYQQCEGFLMIKKLKAYKCVTSLILNHLLIMTLPEYCHSSI
jgi:hypothetical protein